jgi:hypothetical protein
MIAFLVAGLVTAPDSTALRSNLLLSHNSLSPPAAEARATYNRPTTSCNESISFLRLSAEISQHQQSRIALMQLLEGRTSGFV